MSTRIGVWVALALVPFASASPQATSITKPPVTCRVAADRPIPAPATNPAPVAADEQRDLAAAKPGSRFLAPAGPEPSNLAFLRTEVQHYADCDTAGPCYWRDLQVQTDRAYTALDRLLAEHHANTPDVARAQKLAMVLDIDDTSLSTYCEQKREDFGFVPSLFNTWVVAPDASIPIPGTVRLVQHARDSGVTLFFITGRAEATRAATETNLRQAGFAGWEQLILRSEDELSLTAKVYKSRRRQRLVDEGHWTFLLSMGDQWSDLLGQPEAEVSVKLPNPFYYLP